MHKENRHINSYFALSRPKYSLPDHIAVAKEIDPTLDKKYKSVNLDINTPQTLPKTNDMTLRESTILLSALSSLLFVLW